jgi:hypothetical protein
MSKSGKKPVIKGFEGDKRVFQDTTRKFEVHVITGLPHADSLVPPIRRRKRFSSARTCSTDSGERSGARILQ